MGKDAGKNEELAETQQPTWYIGTMLQGHHGTGYLEDAPVAVYAKNIFKAMSLVQRIGGAKHDRTPTLRLATNEEIKEHNLEKPDKPKAIWLQPIK